MPVIQLSPAMPMPRQVENFPANRLDKDGKPTAAKFERSVSGALHLRPGSTLNVTDDELNSLRSDQALSAYIRVIQASEQQPTLPPPPAPPPDLFVKPAKTPKAPKSDPQEG